MPEFEHNNNPHIPEGTAPNTSHFKEILLSPTDIKVKIPTSIYHLSAWHNLGLKHFDFDHVGIQLIGTAEEQYSTVHELAEHYYEVIARAGSQLQYINQEEWMRFLLNGPNLNFGDQTLSTKHDPIQLAFANILFSTSCLCRAESEENFTSQQYHRWEEAALITAAHVIMELSASYSENVMIEELPVPRLQELIAEQIEISEASPRFHDALIGINDEIPTILHYYSKMVAKYGKMGDRLFALSSEKIGNRTNTTQQFILAKTSRGITKRN